MPMHESSWTDGSSSDTQPRQLHDLDRIVLLVSVIYVCDANHRTLAHDESILKRFPTQNVIPFVLFHRTGFTRELASMCFTLISRGMSIIEVETLIIQTRWETHEREQGLRSLHTPEAVHEPFMDSDLSKTPSNNVITKCFLATFLLQEQVYTREMNSINVGASITWDHTFKVATNIGFLRPDNVWVPMYDSLFIVMNSNGSIVSWQLTKGTCFSQIEQCLKDLHIRALQQDCPITSVYVDDFCKLRNKIQSIYGQGTAVKLDVFHAVQRVTKTLSKKNNRFHKCVSDLRLVFRQDGDSENTRVCSTPSPDVMSRKMDAFVAKWRNIRGSDNTLLFTNHTLHAISNLKRHIMCGCLSNIPPGCGTNRNERFHSYINSKFHRSRIGVLLAYALLTAFMYSHNTSVKVHGKSLVRPVIASPLRNTVHTMRLPSFGICRKVHEETQGSDSIEIDVSECEIDLDFVTSLYNTSLYKYYLLKSIESMNLSRLKELVIDFKSLNSVNKDERTSDPIVNSDIHTRLGEYGLQHLEIVKDGNCFFMSVATILSKTPGLGEQTCLEIGASLHLLEDTFMLSKHLRKLFVEELLSERSSNYSAFLIDEDQQNWEDEVKKFLNVGYFNSCIGDLMPYVMANVLNVSIVVIPVDARIPVMYVSPQEVTNRGTVFLVYTQEGPGHYDAAVKCDKQELTLKGGLGTKHFFSCSCGVNSSGTSRKACTAQPLYASRCGCYKNSKACGLTCRCKNCANPHGIRPTQVERKRIRRPHEMQSDIPSAKRFAVDRGETLPSSIWSDFETIVLSVLTEAEKDGDVSIIAKLYNNVVYYSSALFCQNPIPPSIIFRHKSENQVQAKLQHMTK